MNKSMQQKRSSRFSKLFFSGFSLFCIYLFSSAQSSSTQYQSELETKIEANLNKRLEGLVPTERYKLLVNVSAKQKRVKVLIAGETESQSNDRTGRKSEKALPGFQQLEKDAKVPEKVKRNTKSRYAYQTNTVFESVAIDLILDSSLETERKELAESVLTASLKTSYGDKAKLTVTNLDLTGAAVPLGERVSRWFSNYLGDRGASAIDFAYISMIALLIILVTFTLLRQLLRSRRSLSPPKERSKTDPALVKNADALEIESLVSGIIESYVTSPLEVKRFLTLLPESDKKVFLSHVKAPALKTYFERTLGSLAKFEAAKSKEAKTRLKEVATDLGRYLKIQKEQLAHPFGFLETFDLEELSRYVHKSEHPIKLTALLSRFLRKDQYLGLTSDLSIASKVELFKTIHTMQLPQSEYDRVESELRARYEILRDQGIVQIKNTSEIEREILENDRDTSAILEALSEDNVELPEEYQKYRVTWDGLQNIDPIMLKAMLRGLSNDILAKSLVKEPKRAKTWSPFIGEMRFKLVDSIRSRHTNLPIEEVREAQVEVLRAYRTLV